MFRSSTLSEVGKGRVTRPGVRRTVALMLACGVVVGFLPSAAMGQCTANELQAVVADDGATGDWFGLGVGLSGDIAIVGAPLDDNENGPDGGSAFIFRFDGTHWNQEAKLIAVDGSAGDEFGYGVSVDGDVAVVGARKDDDSGENSGVAFVFRFDGAKWNQEAKLLASDGAAGAEFGFSVFNEGDNVIVGAPVGSSGPGSAYVFVFDGADWNEQGELLGSNRSAGDRFGGTVSISGDAAIVGARSGSNDGGERTGAAYIFRFDGANWNQEDRLLADDGAPGDMFGIRVSIDADVAFIGAPFDDNQRGSDAGAAFVFQNHGGKWTQQAKLVASDGTASDQFGVFVSLDGEVAAVTARRGDGEEIDSGSAYVFHFDGTNWNQAARLWASGGQPGDDFGSFVSVSGAKTIVGTMLDDDRGGDSGSAYFFTGLEDCNNNGTLDICDISNGDSRDDNHNGVPDECEGPVCDGDEVLAAKCKTRGCMTTLTGTLKNATPGGLVTFQLDGDPCTDKRVRVKGNGKAKVKYKALSAIFASRKYAIEVIECDVSDTTECP